MSTISDLVGKLPPVITGNIIRNLRQDGADVKQVLQVNKAWRAAFMKAMCNRIEIQQQWREGRFNCRYTVGKDCVDAYMPSNYGLVKQVKLEIELNSLLLGYALVSLKDEPFSSFMFPMAYMMDICIVVCPCSQEINAEEANKQISEFAAFFKQLCPNINSKRAYSFIFGNEIDSATLEFKDTLIKKLYEGAELRHQAEYKQNDDLNPERASYSLLKKETVSNSSDSSKNDSEPQENDSEDLEKDLKLKPGSQYEFDVIEYDEKKKAYLVAMNTGVRCICCRKYCYVKDMPKGTSISLSDIIGKPFMEKITGKRCSNRALPDNDSEK
ncbi:hypothetical protein H4217_004330 [Coemansia sp. RSA 1939]|nr:hypothetical protein H4217_004330 [Coemansia sp. RSA 1939]KAJ2618160.1 hypothetical protein EV177_000196 [Coemansia sp. RSA 1804]